MKTRMRDWLSPDKGFGDSDMESVVSVTSSAFSTQSERPQRLRLFLINCYWGRGGNSNSSFSYFVNNYYYFFHYSDFPNSGDARNENGGGRSSISDRRDRSQQRQERSLERNNHGGSRRGQFVRSLSNADVPPEEKRG